MVYLLVVGRITAAGLARYERTYGIIVAGPYAILSAFYDEEKWGSGHGGGGEM
jgi:hypothetical protein